MNLMKLISSLLIVSCTVAASGGNLEIETNERAQIFNRVLDSTFYTGSNIYQKVAGYMWPQEACSLVGDWKTTQEGDKYYEILTPDRSKNCDSEDQFGLILDKSTEFFTAHPTLSGHLCLKHDERNNWEALLSTNKKKEVFELSKCELLQIYGAEEI